MDNSKEEDGAIRNDQSGKENKFQIATHQLNHIQKVVAVASGKGGVGKSLVTSLLAVELSRKGKRVGILDADITGPSIPKIFGVEGKAEVSELGIFPSLTTGGIKIISVNLLLDRDDMPVVWRGPIISGTVKQFWTDVIWGELDYLLIDMPPGTGDVPLTVFQSIPVNGLIVVASPQDLVALIVKKAYNMAKMMNIPILGIIENMSYLQCPDCGKRIELFGKSKLAENAAALSTKVLGKMPIDPKFAELCDKGEIEKYQQDYLADAMITLEKM
jgi:Mrp family chromosome partitioning ATPase